MDQNGSGSPFCCIDVYHSCGLSTATVEYLCLSVCLGVCLCVLVSVFLSVCVCVSVYTITQQIMA